MKRWNCCCTNNMDRSTSTTASLTPFPVRTLSVSVMKRASVVVATAAMMFVATATTTTNNCILVAEAWAPSHSQQHDYHLATQPVFAVKTPARSKIPVDSSKIITNANNANNARRSSSSNKISNTSTNINTRLLKKKKKVLKKSKIHRPVFDSAIHVHSLAASKAYNKEQHNNKNNSKTFLTHKQEMEYSFQLRTFRTVMKLRESLVTYENNMYIHPTEIQLVNACGLSSINELQQIIDNGQYARNALVTSNAGLVTKLAKQFYNKLKYSIANDGVGTILTLSDMIQEGNIGLMEAVERYEPEQGYRFTTYAYYWIKQRIIRCINNTSRNIRLPIHVQETLTKIKRAKQQLIQENGGTKPTIEQLAQYMNMPEEKLRLYTSTSRNVVSLERPIRTTMTSLSSSPVSVGNTRSPGTSSVGVVNGNNSGSDDTRTLLDTTSCDMLTPEEDLVQDSMRRDVHAVLQSELNTIERQVLLLRFGISTDDGECKSVAETASILNLSRDKVRLLQARALNKLRTHNSLQGYIGGSDGYNNVASSNNNNNNNNNNKNSMASLEKTFQNSPDIRQQQQQQTSSDSSVTDDNNNNNRPDRMWFF